MVARKAGKMGPESKRASLLVGTSNASMTRGIAKSSNRRFPTCFSIKWSNVGFAFCKGQRMPRAKAGVRLVASSTSFHSQPAAYRAPTSAPELVPAMPAGSRPSRCNSRRHRCEPLPALHPRPK